MGRSEKSGKRDQFFTGFKRIVVLFAPRTGEKRAVYPHFAADLVKSDSRPGRGGHFDADDVLVRLVDGQMDLAPGAALAGSMQTDFPFTFAEDLQARRIDHHVHRARAWPARDLGRQCGGSSPQVGVVRHRQVQLTQSHQRLDQPFRRTIRQLEQRLDRQASLNRRFRVPPACRGPPVAGVSIGREYWPHRTRSSDSLG